MEEFIAGKYKLNIYHISNSKYRVYLYKRSYIDSREAGYINASFREFDEDIKIFYWISSITLEIEKEIMEDMKLDLFKLDKMKAFK